MPNSTTMAGIYFNNPIKILHRLKEAGFTAKQAEAQVDVFTDYVEHGFVTKKDLKTELKEHELKFDLKLKDLEFRLTCKTAAIVGSIVGFFFLLEKFVK
jgi:hypothetical protein